MYPVINVYILHQSDRLYEMIGVREFIVVLTLMVQNSMHVPVIIKQHAQCFAHLFPSNFI